jgi:hypothetical protein
MRSQWSVDLSLSLAFLNPCPTKLCDALVVIRQLVCCLKVGTDPANLLSETGEGAGQLLFYISHVRGEVFVKAAIRISIFLRGNGLEGSRYRVEVTAAAPRRTKAVAEFGLAFPSVPQTAI